MIALLATSDELRALWRDDLPLVAALEARGATVRPWVWREQAPGECDVIVVRTTWDYWEHLSEFRDWLERLDERGARVLNPAALMRWNLDKRYLVEVAKRGVAIPNTVVIDEPTGLDELSRDVGSDTVVAKPVFSAGGWYALRLERNNADDQRRLDELVKDQGPLLVQEFVAEVEDGELSLIFFGGCYSHSVIKRAKTGEFRVQAEHGGSVARATPAAPIIEAAERALQALPQPASYARVDGLIRDGELVLMELELIEPELFFEYDDGAAARFADVIVEG